MPKAMPPYIPNPRVLKARQVAARLGMSEGTFKKNRPSLELQGFPRRHNEPLDGWDADAIERWLDALSEIVGGGTDDDKLMGEIYDR